MPQDLINHYPNISFAESVSATNRALIEGFIAKLPKDDLAALSTSPLIIRQLVDGRKLSCPMPLLKTKVALREVLPNESLYVMATDPNSQADIRAFCQHSTELTLNLCQAIPQTAATDTIFHFIITKTDSN